MSHAHLPEAARALAARVVTRLEEMDVVAPPAPLVVAVSGGLDSCALLHMLRFGSCEAPLVVAHLDHGMRAGSGVDAVWLSGLCRAWGLALVVDRAEPTPRSEEEARTARYDFFERVRAQVGAKWVLTAHHADDQAETILFRVLRGAGVEGLQGIPSLRFSDGPSLGAGGDSAMDPSERTCGVVRPLLGIWREELIEYARASRLAWRNDESNDELRFARNALRHRVLPDVEALVAPGARRALVRLGENAASDEEAWSDVMPRLLADVDGHAMRRVGSDGGEETGYTFDRDALSAMGSGLRARVLRHLAALLGVTLDSGATRRAAEFVQAGRSGTGIELGQELGLRRELDCLLLRRKTSTADTVRSGGATAQETGDLPVVIPGEGSGAGDGCVGGERVRVTWATSSIQSPKVGASGPVAQTPSEHSGAEGDGAEGGPPRDQTTDEVTFGLADVAFPIAVRGRMPGDRIRTPVGSKKVKKLLLEARIPSSERDRIAVVVDHSGRVLWVRGVARAADLAQPGSGPDLTVTIAGRRPRVTHVS